MNNLARTTITSMEVSQMVGKDHSKLLRDIRKYCEQLAEAKIGLGDFFSESTYLDSNNQSRPCYFVTKKGCEFIAHKLTGQKGTEFTARYINRFYDMENTIQKKVYETKATSLGEVASYTKEMDKCMEKQGSEPWKICEAFKMVSEQFGIILPDDFVKAPNYQQMNLFNGEIANVLGCTISEIVEGV